MTTTLLRPRRALAHPLWIAALVLLVANDHYLKTAGILPGWLTGKLSDFAGLLVAPAVLAAALFVSTRRGVVLAHAAIGAVFTAIKIAPPLARAFEALTAITPVPWRITVDPTDLVALPMLAVSLFILMPAMRAPATRGAKAKRAEDKADAAPATRGEVIAQRALLMVGSVACMATSPAPTPCPSGQFCGGVAPTETGALVIGNATDTERLVRLRRLKTTVTVDCDTLLIDPTRALSRELFQPAEAWLLQPGRALTLENGVLCSAYMIDADGLDMTVLAWREHDFETTTITTAVGGAGNTTTDGTSREIVMRLDANIGRIALDPHPAIFDAPPAEDPAAEGACVTPTVKEGVDWATPVPLGLHEITGVTVAPDGCTQIDFKNAPRFYLCVPVGSFPFVVGDTIDVGLWDPGAKAADYAEADGAGVSADGLSIESATAAMVVARGNVIARWQSPDFEDYSVEADGANGCSGAHDECGSLVVPLEVSLFGGTSPDITILRAGKEATLSSGAGSLFLVRAEELPIRDTSCLDPGASARLFESVLVRKN